MMQCKVVTQWENKIILRPLTAQTQKTGYINIFRELQNRKKGEWKVTDVFSKTEAKER